MGSSLVPSGGTALAIFHLLRNKEIILLHSPSQEPCLHRPAFNHSMGTLSLSLLPGTASLSVFGSLQGLKIMRGAWKIDAAHFPFRGPWRSSRTLGKGFIRRDPQLIRKRKRAWIFQRPGWLYAFATRICYTWISEKLNRFWEELVIILVPRFCMRWRHFYAVLDLSQQSGFVCSDI